MAQTGQCLCGSVKLSISAEPIVWRMCWCTDCQAFAAGSATYNAMFPADAIQTDGIVHWFQSKADSGNLMSRGFCPNCGTPIFTKGAARPDVCGVRVGVLPEMREIKPQAVIWTDSAPGWVAHDPQIPHFPGSPPAPPTLDR